MFCISRKMLPAREMMSSPAAVVRVSEFFLQELELPAHTGLRGMQLARGGRDVESVLVNRHEIA
jgi:hypothetical protein